MSAMTPDSLSDLLACVAAFGRSLDESFDPTRFLAEFSARSQRLAPHDYCRTATRRRPPGFQSRVDTRWLNTPQVVDSLATARGDVGTRVRIPLGPPCLVLPDALALFRDRW